MNRPLLPDAILANPLTLLILDEVIARRAKQLRKHPAAHDDTVEADGTLALVAALLALGDEWAVDFPTAHQVPTWGLHLLAKRRDDRREMLIDAITLLVAEVERLDRASRRDVGFLVLRGDIPPEEQGAFVEELRGALARGTMLPAVPDEPQVLDADIEAAFLRAMEGYLYGREETANARAWFGEGWKARRRPTAELYVLVDDTPGQERYRRATPEETGA